MVTLIESTVRVTIRHSDSPPIASDAATASVSREVARSTARLLKPAAPGDRIIAKILNTTATRGAGIMAQIFKARANPPRCPAECAGFAGNLGAAPRPENGKMAARKT